MKGAGVIGFGSQGCILHPKLKLNESKMAVRNHADPSKISKIFFNKGVFEQEVKILTRVMQATQGIGVIDINNTFSASNLNPGNKANVESNNSRTGCKRVKEALRTHDPIYVLNQKKITGDLRNLKEKKDANFFKNAYEALLKLKKAKIVHCDIADRNIFYDDTGALIGDFGYGVDLADADEALLTELLKKFNNPSIMNIFMVDQITPEACLAVVLWFNWENKHEYIKDLYSYIYYTYDDIPIERFALKPINDPEGTFRLRNGTLYQKYVNVAHNAFIMGDKHAFKEYMIHMLLQSDIKRYVKVILNKLEAPDEQKDALMNAIWFNQDYTQFHKILGLELTEKIGALAQSLSDEDNRVDARHDQNFMGVERTIVNSLNSKLLEKHKATIIANGIFSDAEITSIIKTKQEAAAAAPAAAAVNAGKYNQESIDALKGMSLKDLDNYGHFFVEAGKVSQKHLNDAKANKQSFNLEAMMARFNALRGGATRRQRQRRRQIKRKTRRNRN